MKHFQQGASDYENGINMRLEAVSDSEYTAYMRGREFAKRKGNKDIADKPDNVIRVNHIDNVEPIDFDEESSMLESYWMPLKKK